MTRLFVGTSGFSYKEWKGSFYPEDLPNAKMLAYYGERLPSVEINNTFYRMPKTSVLESWAEQVPEDFRFVLKASRRITHQQRLKESEDSLGYLLETSKALGDRRGPFLFQLPPFMKKDAARLRDFLALLPADVRGAFEFRNETWFDDEIFTALGDGGAALCISHGGKVETPFVATAPWGYLRLRAESYGAGELEDFAERIAKQEWGETYAFFKHEDEGAGPRLADRFRGLFVDSRESRV